MKKLYSIVLFCTVFSSNIFSQSFKWAVSGGLDAYDYGYGTATDDAGNVFVAGKFEEAAIFSGVTVACRGNHDMFVAKYNSSGDLLWINTGGGLGGDYAHCMAIDNLGNVLVAGEIEGSDGSVWFNNKACSSTIPSDSTNATNVIGKTDNDVFIAKYTGAGDLVWVKSAGGYLNDKAYGVSTDIAGNAYITGQFEGLAGTYGATFGSLPAIYSVGYKDIFIAKYNSAGVEQWVKRAGGTTGDDEGKGISVNAAGEIYVTGFFKGTASFEGTTGTTSVSANTTVAPGTYDDAFLARYDTDGNLKWVQKAGGDYDDDAWGITANNSGNIYITGEFNGYATFDTKALTVTGMADVFVACYNSSGMIQWVQRAGGIMLDRARGICSDVNSNVYITGQYGGTATFGSTTLTAADSSDIFVASYDGSGAFRWALSGGGAADAFDNLGFESGIAVSVDKAGNVYATGSFLDASSFGTTTPPVYHKRTDMFLAKIDPTGSVGINENITDNSFNIFPNPNNGRFTLSFNIPEEDNYTVELSSVIGQVIYSEKLNKFSGDYAKNIDASGFGKGIYSLRLTNSQNKSEIKKVIVY